MLLVLRGILDGFRGCRTNTAHTCWGKKGHSERMSDSVVFGQLGCEVREPRGAAAHQRRADLGVCAEQSGLSLLLGAAG